MIDPRELRIGNLVYQGVTSTAKNEWQAVRQIKSNVISTDEFQSIPFEMLNGILITEEWLIKLGFENWGYNTINEYEKELVFCLHNRIEGTSDFKVILVESNYGGQNETHWRVKIDSDIVYLAYDFKYIHQLQNIFYTFMGQELTIQ